MIKSLTLYRAVGNVELALIELLDWKRFPPRLPEQPIFYPVLTEGYAIQIARDWNARNGADGHVTRFSVDAIYIAKFAVHQVGARTHREYWIPAEQLEDFNDHIVSRIEVVASFGYDQH